VVKEMRVELVNPQGLLTEVVVVAQVRLVQMAQVE
jgi:hypothetical protein